LQVLIQKLRNAILSKFLFFVLAVILPTLLFAYQSPGKSQGYVNDFASLLNQADKSSLEAKLASFTQATGNELSVVIVKNLGEDTIENFAVELFKEWGIGQKGKDNGALLLISKDDREMRIEVGYGLEGDLTDSQSGSIIRNILTPAFQNNDFYGGIDAAVNQIINDVSPEYATGVGLPENSTESNTSFNFDFSNIAFFIFFIPIWIASILARSKSWWAGGVVGGIIGIVIGLFFGFVYLGIIATAFLIPAGLLFDFLVSRAYSKSVGKGTRPPWWIGGGGFGGRGGGFGGGFGGFGGGMSGGGGASGRW